MIDDPGDLVYPKIYLAMYLASWLVANTAVPERYYATVTAILIGVGFVLVLGAVQLLGLEQTQCKAAKANGERCSRDADGLTADLCWQHQDLNDVELHPEAIDGTVSIEER